MEIKVQNKIIKRCIDCPYFQNSMDGCECWHPTMKKLAPYGNLIDIHTPTEFPIDCPIIIKGKVKSDKEISNPC